MKPISVNLATRTNFWRKISLAVTIVFLIITFGVTLLNTYDYLANNKVIESYDSRVKVLNKRSEQKRKASQKIVIDTKEDDKLKKDLNYLSGILDRNMFPLTDLLSEIEKVKPDRIDIMELIFSEDLSIVSIKGESDHVRSVTEFLVAMDRSRHFDINLSKEEINDDKRIIFELTARWKSLENDQKI